MPLSGPRGVIAGEIRQSCDQDSSYRCRKENAISSRVSAVSFPRTERGAGGPHVCGGSRSV